MVFSTVGQTPQTCIPKGRELTEAEQEYVVNVIMEWIGREIR